MKHLTEKILENEMIWLNSITCDINRCVNFTNISNKVLNTVDFNFTIINNDTLNLINQKCIRLSNQDTNFIKRDIYLQKSGYKKLDTYDINYIKINTISDYNNEFNIYDINYIKINTISDYNNEFNIKEVQYKDWFIDDLVSRRDFENIKYYHCYHKDKEIGRFCLVHSSIMYGIYDFEIYSDCRYKGLGTHILNKIESILESNSLCFIQTWDKNLIARKCYENANFNEFERLYRYSL